MKKSNWIVTLLGIVSSALLAFSAHADHAWGRYHWDLSTAQTTADPLDLGDNTLTAEWNLSLDIASDDWNDSVIKNEIKIGSSNSNCDPTAGQVEVCNGAYGNNGWLGIASIWITRGKNNHITQGVVKLNDTYFDMPYYDSAAWRDFVMCQEVGHTFGLGHQDENFNNANLGSCMDYTDYLESIKGFIHGSQSPIINQGTLYKFKYQFLAWNHYENYKFS